MKAKFTPAKKFFVEMLTRDIDLKDSILDLIDNCVDGAVRKNSEIIGGVRNLDKPYSGYHAHITLNKKKFEINDNCGGIGRDLAEKYAFRLGRSPDRIDDTEATVGIYGIGMKRAIFKMGRECIVKSRTSTDNFLLSIDGEWLDDDDNWELDLQKDPKPNATEGTQIVISNLRNQVANAFSEDADFIREIQDLIRTHYSIIISKGFEIKVNSNTIPPSDERILFDNNSMGKSGGIAPYIFKSDSDGVNVRMAIGFLRKLPDTNEVESETEGKTNKTKYAGITVVCNDRVVIYADKSHITGWGESGIPNYHTQFIAIYGVVVLNSKDVKKLPLTTTKRGVELNSVLWSQVKERIKEGLKLFTGFTNQWKSISKEREAIKDDAAPLTITEIFSRIPSNKFNSVSKGLKGDQFRPKLPVPVNLSQDKVIRFSRTIPEIEIVSNYLFGDVKDANLVGNQAFSEILAKAQEH